jgi:hypothetical protein
MAFLTVLRLENDKNMLRHLTAKRGSVTAVYILVFILVFQNKAKVKTVFIAGRPREDDVPRRV